MFAPVALGLALHFPFLLPVPPADAAPAPAPAEAPVLQDEEAAADEGPEWTGNVDAGFTQTSGNTKTRTIGINLGAKRETEDDRYTFKAYFNEQKDNGNTTADNLGASLQYDRFVSEKWYWYVNTSGDRDEQADLDLRFRLGAGGGYQFRKDEKIELSGEAGLTYTDEYFSVMGPPDPDASYLAARLAGHYQNQISEDVVFNSDAELYPSLEDSSDFTARSDNRLRVTLTESMYTQVQAVFDFDNSPAPGNKNWDTLVMIGIGWAF